MIFDLCNAGITIKITIFHFLKKISFLGKNDYFLQEGEICESTAFVNSGVFIYLKFIIDLILIDQFKLVLINEIAFCIISFSILG